MAFAMDRDLLAIEANVFRDVSWLGQRLIKGTGDVAGTTLALATFDHDFVSVGVGTGSVVLLGGVAHEVLSRTDATHVEVSKIRATIAGSAIPPDAGAGLEVLVYSFAPQIEIVHREVLRLVGIEPSDLAAMVTEASVTNPGALVMIEALGALHLAYAAAAALAGEGSAIAQRAAMYARLVARERARARAELDLDGDGRGDATRRLNVLQLLRA